MKNSIAFGYILLLGSAGFLWGAPVVSQPVQTKTPPPPTPYSVVGKDANSSVWQRTVYEFDPSGQAIPKLHSYTEVATGLHYQQNGQWLDSKEEISILPNGTATAIQGQHQAYFPGDIYQGQIELVTPDRLQLYSRPLGLSYFDGTNTVMIAVLTNSIGQVLGANQVIYTNAFTGLNADLLYTYTKAGFEQDIVLRQQPLTPESFGLNADTATLQVFTEFFTPPQPAIQTTTLPSQAGLSLIDNSLGFGQMQMVPGRAFLLGQNARDVGAMVGKQWVQVEGRQFLVEQVPVNAIVDGLITLPSTAKAVGQGKTQYAVSRHLVLPPQRFVKSDSSKPMMLSKAGAPKQGFVLDYQTLNSSQTNYTFQGDNTYYISGAVNLYGTNNTFEGGTVLKYTNNASVNLESGGGLNWQASAYRPVVFTARDDNSVGVTISGSTGSPTNYYANPALNIALNGSSTISASYLRILWASQAIIDNNYGTLSLYHSQLVNCLNGINVPTYGSLSLRNLLFANVATNFNIIYSTTLNAQNTTFNGSSCIIQGTSDYTSPIFTNCIFANVNQLSNGVVYAFSGSHNGFYSSQTFGTSQVTNTFFPFQNVGAGGYYLTNGCAFTNAGTTIDASLMANLRQMTTHAPLVYSNTTITTNLILYPQPIRDTNAAPDLGYHYDPIDYAFGQCDLHTNLTITAGTAVGFFHASNYGISLDDGANLTCTGTATAPCWMVTANMVQEGGGVWSFSGMCNVMFNGSGSGNRPQMNAQFAKWSTGTTTGHFRDNWAAGQGNLSDCEFYNGVTAAYDLSSLTFTNCLFYRTAIYGYAYGQARALNTTIQNCTFYNGFMTLNRYAGQATTMWTIKNTAFDGTGFSFTDNLNSTNTAFDFNAYNTNNLSGLSYPYPYTPVSTNRLEYIGAHDVSIGTYNWQSSWFGNLYQPTNSLLIDRGNTNANLLGLYHFTTQTNQAVEANSIVDIGYHYVATDTNGIPLDSNGDGIPDYIEDANGNGLADGGETNWGIAILTQPASQSVIQTSNATFTVIAGGIAPLVYQWYFNSSPVANATNATLTINNVQTNNAGTYDVVVTNSLGSLTSSNAVLTVLLLPTISITNPVNNALFIASLTNLALSAIAADGAGTITQVQFFQGTTSLGMVTNSPYNLTWSNATTGNYALTAVLADSGGHTATSSVVTITITPIFATNTMTLWLKADAITGLTNNASVGTWFDSSGWSNNATQNTLSQQPLYVTNTINGYPTVQFNGTNDQLMLAASPGTNNFTVLVVAKTSQTEEIDPEDNSQNANGGYSGEHYLFGGIFNHNNYGEVGVSLGINGASVYEYAYNTIGSDQWGALAVYNGGIGTGFSLVTVKYTSQKPSIYLNGSLMQTGLVSSRSQSVMSQAIGYGNADSSQEPFSGNVAEILIFNRSLSNNDQLIAEGYLNAKYGIVNPPSAPTNLTASAVSSNQIAIAWTSPMTNVMLFRIEQKQGAGGVYQEIATVDSTTTSYFNTGLVANTQYYYRVRANNLSGNSGYCNEASATTTTGVTLPLSDLRLWLKADTDVVQVGTNPTVNHWSDQSGNGNDATSPALANNPTWIPNALNGMPVVQFVATNSQYLILPYSINPPSAAEVFIVLKATSSNPSHPRGLWTLGSSAAGEATGYPESDGSIADNFYGQFPTYYSIGVPAQPLTQYNVYEVTAQNGNWMAWIDGLPQFQTTNNTYGGLTDSTLTLGAGTQGGSGFTYFDGDIAEMLLFDRALTASERDCVGGYLFSKYGLSASTTNAAPVTAPTNLITTGVSPYQLNLQWLPTSTNAFSFHVERKLGTGGVYQEIGTVASYVSNYVDTTACPSNTYYYEVKSHNLFGDAYSTSISPPTVSMTNWPVAILQNSTNLLGAWAADAGGSVSNVAFFANNQFVGITTSAPYTNRWIPIVNRQTSLSALATDNQGNSQFSAAVIAYLDSNGDGIPDYLQVMQGNDPLNPWTSPAPDTNGPPVITLLIPTNAVIVH
jgi:hypothetical protein